MQILAKFCVLLALGISRYHPDPVGAIQAAQKTKR
jgi:hypothetical protein